MKVLALDFDGVVCDSFREVLATALAGYEAIAPGSPLVADLRSRHGVGPWHDLDLGGDPVAGAFEALMPLGNRAEDFGVALRAIESGAAVGDQAAYDRFHASIDDGWIERYHRLFYEKRRAARERDREGWIGLHAPYPPFLDLLRRRAGDAVLALATAKDRESAVLLLEHLDVGDLFEPSLVMDKETGVSKTAHLSRIRERAGVTFAEVTFVDDKANHLRKVAPLGVRPVLAAWGFNSAREHADARASGFAVVNFDDAEGVLFGGGNDS
ncbi:MAG TPA: HAD family hydrolase [Candidatus Sulfomarinibacteraceae bacterium]|nr:HAD family hydrolase [Candidatus Sulfomarinibacteraceae bacterium]